MQFRSAMGWHVVRSVGAKATHVCFSELSTTWNKPSASPRKYFYLGRVLYVTARNMRVSAYLCGVCFIPFFSL